jgi:hypothetical protein
MGGRALRCVDADDGVQVHRSTMGAELYVAVDADARVLGSELYVAVDADAGVQVHRSTMGGQSSTLPSMPTMGSRSTGRRWGQSSTLPSTPTPGSRSTSTLGSELYVAVDVDARVQVHVEGVHDGERALMLTV